MKNMLGPVVGLVMAASCVTEGRDFRTDTAWIKKNATKQEDVRMLLGTPHSVGDSGGVSTWTYGYYKYHLIGKSYTKEIKFYWNQDRTVQNYSLTSSFPDDVGGQQQKSAGSVPPQGSVNQARTPLAKFPMARDAENDTH